MRLNAKSQPILLIFRDLRDFSCTRSKKNYQIIDPLLSEILCADRLRTSLRLVTGWPSVTVSAVKERWNLWLPVTMMVVFAITRWPTLMPSNFSAAYAIAFCAGVYFPPRLRWVLPLGTLFVMDLVLNVFYYGAAPWDPYIVTKLATFAAIIWLGTKFNARSNWLVLLGGGILGAFVFYLLTNIASWVFDPGYPKTLSGLIQALTTGLPGYPPTWMFFKNTLLSGGLFTGLFCGAMKASEAVEKVEEEEPAEEAAGEPLPEEA